jgi:hypothetical protein
MTDLALLISGQALDGYHSPDSEPGAQAADRFAGGV